MQTGLEVFLDKAHRQYRKLRLGILCNQASQDRNLSHIVELILQKKLKLNVTCFIGPQHGIRGEKQDNMVESEDFTDPRSGLPVFSLYGTSRVPTTRLLESIDAFVVDLQDIGSRVYTFMYTMANCMRAAKEHGKKVIVLDRPNPVGGLQIEGNVLEPNFTSFVGQFPICVRHGLTMAELALLFNEAFGIGCELDIVKCRGWKRSYFAEDWKRDWVPPSPNIPNPTAAHVFSGSVFFEGTNVSEGRGTTRPFEWVGAPFIQSDALAKVMNGLKLKGVYFRPIFFQPTYHKGKDQVCGGVQVHITDKKKFNSFQTGLWLLGKIAELYPKDFKWKEPPYEYEHTRMPIDLIAGSDLLRKSIDDEKGVKGFEQKALQELEGFRKLRKKFLIYD